MTHEVEEGEIYGPGNRLVLTREQQEHLQGIRPNLAEDIYDGMTGGWWRWHWKGKRQYRSRSPAREMD